MLRILFVANGHGETAIAARIAADVATAVTPAGLDLFPLVGTGAGAAPLAVVGPRATMPSGGLVAMGNVRAFARDLAAGFAVLAARQLAFLREIRDRYDAVVVVGDVYALALALAARARTVFVGTAKSVYVAPYGPFERTMLRRAERVFVRDAATAARLRAERVEAEAPGNVIVDLVGAGEPPPGRWLGLLPGSRAEAYADAVRLARVARRVGVMRPGLGALVSVAATLDPARLAGALAGDGWRVGPGEGAMPFEASDGPSRLAGWCGDLGPLLAASEAILGQAGTANEQAAARGIPVVALAGESGGREDWYRMRQRRLLGDALLLVPAEPAAAAEAVTRLLADPVRLARMRAAGPERMGPPGGAAAIARAVLETAA